MSFKTGLRITTAESRLSRVSVDMRRIRAAHHRFKRPAYRSVANNPTGNPPKPTAILRRRYSHNSSAITEPPGRMSSISAYAAAAVTLPAPQYHAFAGWPSQNQTATCA